MFDSFMYIWFLWIFIPLAILFLQGLRAYLRAKAEEKKLRLLESSDEIID